MRYIFRVNKASSARELTKKLKCSYKQFMEKNQLISDQLYVGQCVLIEQNECKEYVVQPFDTIEKIAKKFCVDTKKLSEENGGEVFLGQTIIIPVEK